MIRRDLKLTDGASSWLLVSQVEHARVSGLLAQHWIAADLSPYEHGSQPRPTTTTDETLAAITHHDDGWAQWEAKPRIDLAKGQPYSFMNELPLIESLTIWDGSIASARRIGVLAGWMVAGHFSELLQSGNHANNALAIKWLQKQKNLRDAWLREWQQADSTNSLSVAKRALRLLQACDFLSLWLCCDCPVASDESVEDVKPFELDWPQDAIGPYNFSAQRAAPSLNAPEAFVESGWFIVALPWPFDQAHLDLVADAWQAPVRRYASSQELLQSRRPVKLRWTINRNRP